MRKITPELIASLASRFPASHQEGDLSVELSDADFRRLHEYADSVVPARDVPPLRPLKNGSVNQYGLFRRKPRT